MEIKIIEIDGGYNIEAQGTQKEKDIFFKFLVGGKEKMEALEEKNEELLKSNNELKALAVELSDRIRKLEKEVLEVCECEDFHKWFSCKCGDDICNKCGRHHTKIKGR